MMAEHMVMLCCQHTHGGDELPFVDGLHACVCDTTMMRAARRARVASSDEHFYVM